MNLLAFDSKTRSEKGTDFFLKDARTGKETDACFHVLGPDGAIYRAAERQALKARNKRIAEGDDDVTFTDAERVELVASCITGWRNIEERGQAVEFNSENVRRVLESYPIILRQLDNHIGDARNFLAEVAENLANGQSGASA